jgi:hypothetical protein
MRRVRSSMVGEGERLADGSLGLCSDFPSAQQDKCVSQGTPPAVNEDVGLALRFVDVGAVGERDHRAYARSWHEAAAYGIDTNGVEEQTCEVWQAASAALHGPVAAE